MGNAAPRGTTPGGRALIPRPAERAAAELWHLADSDRVFASSPYLRTATFPQLGLLTLAAILRDAGHAVAYRDRAYDRLDRDAVRAIVERRPLFVGIYSNIALRADATDLIAAVRDVSTDVPVLVGGPGHFEAAHYFRAGATAVVAGEADGIIVEIARRLAAGEPLAGMPGVWLPDGGGAEILAPRPDDLEALPRPAWDLAPPGRFRNAVALIQRNPWYVQLASRGCPYRCAFCSHAYAEQAHDYRLRAVPAVIAETTALRGAYGVRHVKFQDDTFGGKRAWLAEFCDRMTADGPRVTWNCSSHPGLFRTETRATLAAMKRAGCTSLHFGLQSTSPAILSAIGRHPDEPRWLAGIVPVMRAVGLYAVIDLIVGLPGETRETIAEHRDYVRRIPVHMIQVFPLQVVPGTRLDREYPDGKTTALSLAEVHEGVRRIHRGFLLRPAVWARNLAYIVRRNPGYLRTLPRLVPYLVYFALGLYRMAVWRSDARRIPEERKDGDER
jgi:radical SAM superfamily enzyme YgiQ (UPF0313 family)